MLPFLLGFLALAIVTVRGLFVRERTPLPALAAAAATGALILGLYRFYLGGVEADEQGTSGEPDALDAALLLGGAGTSSRWLSGPGLTPTPVSYRMVRLGIPVSTRLDSVVPRMTETAY